jgi:uncharacterized protein YqfA (UPF0365 family)
MVFIAAVSVTIVPLLVMAFFAIVLLSVVFRHVHIWFQAIMAGVFISLPEIIGMQFKRGNATVVVQALIMAKQGGVAVSCTDLEKAYLQGANLPRIILVLIEAKKQGIDITFEELVDPERHDQLRKQLKMEEDG